MNSACWFSIRPGWLRVRPPYLSTVRALLSGRLEALLPGGLWNGCSDLHPGDWFYVNTSLSLRSYRRSYTLFLLFFPSNFRHSPQSLSRDFPSTTNPPGNITRLFTRPMTGAFPVRSPKTWQHFAVFRPKQQGYVPMCREFVSKWIRQSTEGITPFCGAVSYLMVTLGSNLNVSGR